MVKDNAILSTIEIDEAEIQAGIDSSDAAENNSAPTYNPFLLMQATPTLDSETERDLKEISIGQALK